MNNYANKCIEEKNQNVITANCVHNIRYTISIFYMRN